MQTQKALIAQAKMVDPGNFSLAALAEAGLHQLLLGFGPPKVRSMACPRIRCSFMASSMSIARNNSSGCSNPWMLKISVKQGLLPRLGEYPVNNPCTVANGTSSVTLSAITPHFHSSTFVVDLRGHLALVDARPRSRE